MVEEYGFKIAAEGQKSLEILDKTFNEQSQYFLDKHGLRAGMSVLDIGCGLGYMTQYLAEKVGANGTVLAIDNNADQLRAASKRCPENLKSRIKWLQADIYELDKIAQQFDLIYCRFVLHHIYQPRLALSQIYKALKTGGLYIAIEGVVNYAFSLPNHPGWQAPMLPIDVPEGETRNANIGKTLINLIQETPMRCLAAEIFQPILLKTEVRELLLQEMLDSKENEIYTGNITAYDWERKFNTVKMCIEDPSVIIGFYAGNFVAACKK